MNSRLKAAIEAVCDGAIPIPIRYEMPGGGMAVLVPTILYQDGRRHGEFPVGIEFEMIVLDAMGDVVSKKDKVYR